MHLQAVTQRLTCEAVLYQACNLTSLTSPATVIGTPAARNLLACQTCATCMHNTVLEPLANEHCRRGRAANGTSGLRAEVKELKAHLACQTGCTLRDAITTCQLRSQAAFLRFYKTWIQHCMSRTSTCDAARRPQEMWPLVLSCDFKGLSQDDLG